MEVVTYSSLQRMKRCLKSYFFEYILLLNSDGEAQQLRIGSAIHLGLERWANGASVGDAVADAVETYSTVPPWADPVEWEYERNTVAAMLYGYFWYYQEDQLKYAEVEKEFLVPILYPRTGRPSRNFRMAGKRDGLVEWNEKFYILERKSAGEDIGPGAVYWQRLRIDHQCSNYVVAARHQGYEVAGVLYDVIRKPTLRPLRATRR